MRRGGGRGKAASNHHTKVVVSPTMNMGELQEWLRHYDLSISVSFANFAYTAELREPIGNGSSVRAIEAQAADFDVAVIAACENYQKLEQSRTLL